jgi:hypothetical protein
MPGVFEPHPDQTGEIERFRQDLLAGPKPPSRFASPYLYGTKINLREAAILASKEEVSTLRHQG